MVSGMSAAATRERNFFAYWSSLLQFSGLAILALIFSLFAIPSVAYAQYVPVYDEQVQNSVDQLDSDFNQYVTDLFKRWDDTYGKNPPDGTTDSLRDLISGSDPKMPGGKTECKDGDNIPGFLSPAQQIPAYAYGYQNTDPKTWGPWKYAFETSSRSGGDLPESVPPNQGPSGTDFVQVNYSKSLRCLLQEVVEWQKLGLSLQINSILKNYIADAQAAQLSKQLQGKLAAANFNFAKAGEEVNNDGVTSAGAIFSQDSNADQQNINTRVTENYTDQAMAPTNTVNPQGGLNNCTTFKGDIVAAVVNQNRSKTENPANFSKDVTGCTLSGVIPEANAEDFLTGNYNTGSNLLGGNESFMSILNDPANSSLGALTLNRQVLRGRQEYQEKLQNSRNSTSNMKPTLVCSGDTSDPHCVDTISINPAGTNLGNINHQQDILSDNVSTQSLDSQSGTSSAIETTVISTQTGLAGAPVVPLETAGTAVNSLVQEFYDTIDIGYFGLQAETKEWAQGTMLMIYDEMKFDPTQSNTVTTNGRVAVPVNY